eukprot:CAMPEP_0196792756 /NCGR_PEP_ID=MMETSP1104-20130614/31937_1 /TAXON_ID=33652 /ORGANISM="Cafeteria sp., Strain Caron Lab Isolate" /LENGTH=74 /DNA_ID=CAMNT_0042163121 /DNA_START=6 /DNA_END=227 /DNA_ORIENTATION=-
MAQDLQRAALLLKEAADAGHPASQFLLGAFLVNGQGVPSNPQLGRAWIAKAAEGRDERTREMARRALEELDGVL